MALHWGTGTSACCFFLEKPIPLLSVVILLSDSLSLNSWAQVCIKISSLSYNGASEQSQTQSRQVLGWRLCEDFSIYPGKDRFAKGQDVVVTEYLFWHHPALGIKFMASYGISEFLPHSKFSHFFLLLCLSTPFQYIPVNAIHVVTREWEALCCHAHLQHS